jgi:DNA polymerase-4
MVEALRLCPQAIVVPHHFDRYRAASNAFFDILSSYSPLVESLSLDEAFIDVTASQKLFGDGRTIAQRIRREVRKNLDLVASVGVAPTKFIAKIASDIDKPDGLRVVTSDCVLEFLHPLPITRLWGVGRATRARLESMGLNTIGDVASYPESVLRARLGDTSGSHLSRLARGIDERDVDPEHSPVSIGHEETFERDKGSHEELEPYLLQQADRVASRLRQASLRTRSVVVKIKYADFRQITRSRKLVDATSDGLVIGRTAVDLASGVSISDHSKTSRVRLCGVSAAGLEDRQSPRQLTLAEDERKRGERLGDTLDDIQRRFGDASIGRASYQNRSDED